MANKKPSTFLPGERVRITQSVDPQFNNTIGKTAVVTSYNGKFGLFERPLQSVYYIEIEETGQFLGALHEELESCS